MQPIELHPKWVVSAGAKFNVDESSEFTVQADYSSQGNARETIGGVMYGYKLGEFTDDPKYVLGMAHFCAGKMHLFRSSNWICFPCPSPSVMM